MIWIVIISFISAFCIMGYSAHKKMLDWVAAGIVVGLLIVIFSVSLTLLYLPEHTPPSAIDVYRGNTTLKISYEDNVPIDTVVVFKNEYIKSLSHE